MKKLVVLIKFNRNDLYINKKNYVAGSRFYKTLNRKEWWENRLKILKEITIPILKKQTYKNFDIVACFTTDIPKGYADEVIKYLKDNRVKIWWDDRKKKDFVEPFQFLHDNYKKKNIILVNLDSDDVYEKTAFKKIMKIKFQAGQVYICRNGYVYDIPTDRLAEYKGDFSPPPFFAFTFTKKSLKSKSEYVNYRNKYKLWVEHPHLDKAKVKVEMPDGLFCYVFHKYNVTSSWDNSHHKEKIKKLIEEKEKEKILKDLCII